MGNTFGHGFTPKEIEKARGTYRRAMQWRLSNPQAWALMVAQALDLASQAQPISAQALIESVRKKAFVDRYGNDTRTNNSYAPVFARLLWLEHPETRAYIKLRRCAVCEVMGL